MNPWVIGIGSSIAAALIIALLLRSRPLANRILAAISRDFSFGRRIRRSGISNFYSSREEYALYRGATRLRDYLALAKKTINIAAYWMAYGTEMENIASFVAQMTKSPKSVKVTIATVDPTGSYIDPLAKYLDMSRDELVLRICASLAKLWEARESLSDEEKQKFSLKVYDTVPIASVIMLDVADPTGRIQIDLKPYKAARQNSFSIELQGEDTHLFRVCRKAWTQLLEDAEAFDPQRHLADFVTPNGEDKDGQ